MNFLSDLGAAICRFESESLSMSLSFECPLKQLSPQQDFLRNTSTPSQICKQRRENKLCLRQGSQKLLRIVLHLAKPACHNSHLPDSLSQPSEAGEQSKNEQHSTPGGLLMLKSQCFLQDHKQTFSFPPELQDVEEFQAKRCTAVRYGQITSSSLQDRLEMPMRSQLCNRDAAFSEKTLTLMV